MNFIWTYRPIIGLESNCVNSVSALTCLTIQYELTRISDLLSSLCWRRKSHDQICEMSADTQQFIAAKIFKRCSIVICHPIRVTFVVALNFDLNFVIQIPLFVFVDTANILQIYCRCRKYNSLTRFNSNNDYPSSNQILFIQYTVKVVRHSWIIIIDW